MAAGVLINSAVLVKKTGDRRSHLEELLSSIRSKLSAKAGVICKVTPVARQKNLKIQKSKKK